MSMLSFALESKLELLEEKDFIYKEWGKRMQASGKFIPTSMYSNSTIGDGLKCLQRSTTSCSSAFNFMGK
jgi:hypothetical protein